MGLRFAFGGGREGWLRTCLTSVGVGVGVAVLLFAASVPHMMEAQDARKASWTPTSTFQEEPRKSDQTLLSDTANTEFRGESVRGRILDPDGEQPPVPAGLEAIPEPGEVVVSPKLRELLRSSEGDLLKPRVPGEITGTISKEGLAGPQELAFYAGSDDLTSDTASRVDGYGPQEGESQPLPAALMLLIVVACVVLLLPVGAFIAAAVRFGGERRDRRLAALRLTGADTRMTRRIAAGEAAGGSLLGLAVGGVFFLLLRESATAVRVQGLSLYSSDLLPHPGLTALLAIAVPGCAIAVTLLALRGVVIEPLGVVRQTPTRKRRLWWRVLPMLLGVALLLPYLGGFAEGETQSDVDTFQLAAAVVLILVGVTALLPWLVESVVRRTRGGPVALQLAVRRLQLDSGTSARAVSGVTVAIAGAIALQVLFGAVQEDETTLSGGPRFDSQLLVSTPAQEHATAEALRADLDRSQGVRETIALTSSFAIPADAGPDGMEDSVTVGDCASLRTLAKIDSCEPGDTFVVTDSDPGATPKPGTTYAMDDPAGDAKSGDKGRAERWKLPEDARPVSSHQAHDDFSVTSGILTTPEAVDDTRLTQGYSDVHVRTDPGNEDTTEHVRNTAARFSMAADTFNQTDTRVSQEFAAIKRGIYAASAALLLLIGASLTISTLEQLRERKRLLSVLVAFGTRRSTLGWSVFWQNAIPILLGVALAAATGVGLGLLLLQLAGVPMSVDWLAIGGLASLGGLLILLVTLLSAPVLWRMMRPDGLRTE
ncbi:hypothetical protein AN216_05640 [Streptomyces oceani]|uniref:ABC3 transporter permease C-terminal domain-containing protein n=2 Tax=Streptomyces oceani TaxID=1075402 RepID=A0A1E7KLP0_9ACTN|nr:hypothetical protein AN216_05640 [Streptomyces oceani]